MVNLRSSHWLFSDFWWVSVPDSYMHLPQSSEELQPRIRIHLSWVCTVISLPLFFLAFPWEFLVLNSHSIPEFFSGDSSMRWLQRQSAISSNMKFWSTSRKAVKFRSLLPWKSLLPVWLELYGTGNILDSSVSLELWRSFFLLYWWIRKRRMLCRRRMQLLNLYKLI